MVFDVPLFAFGVFITLLVLIGVLLALAEFRQVQAASRSKDESAGHVGTKHT